LASAISIGEQFLWVSNQRLSTLIDFALEVAAQRPGGVPYAASLRRFHEEQSFPGIGFDLGERFPTIDEQKFWAGVFHDVARRIYLRQLGNHDVSFWQSSAIGDAYVVARMLTRSVHGEETGWHPATEDTAEAEAYYNGPVNIRV
jgi:hypothetical protein